ncbi:MAG: potassium transporter TrkG [Pseudomonadota bacterium]
MIAFIFYFSALGAILSCSMLLPALVAFGLNEVQIGYRILLYGALGAFISVAILLAIRGRQFGLERNTAIILGVVSWIAFPVILAVPLLDVAQISLVEALFQSVSALTTTGAVIFENVDAVPRSIIFMLAQIQWLGGFLTLITLVLVLAPWEVGGLPQVGSASVAASIVASHSRLVSFCGQLLRIYLFLTLMCFLFLVLAGVSPYNASILSFTALSTGGVVPSSESLDILLGMSGMFVMALFLLIGATSIFWHQDIFEFRYGELLRHRESYFVVAVVCGLSAYIAINLFVAAGSPDVLPRRTALAEGVLNASSIVSTSGLQSRPGVFSLLPASLVLLLIFIGGGCYSTSGGIKFFRIGGIFSLSRHDLDKLVYPNAVSPTRFGNTKFDTEFMKAVWSLFAIVIFVVAVGVCTLAATGMEFQIAFTAVISAVSNAGPVYSQDWAGGTADLWPTYGAMNGLQQSVLGIIMLLGRLEVISVIACFSVLVRSLK